MHNLAIQHLVGVAVFAPLATALFLALAVPLRRHGWAAAYVSVASVLVVLAASVTALIQGWGAPPVEFGVTWLKLSGVPVASLGLRVDGLALTMLGVVGLVATCVQVFSLGYMSGEPRPALGRYFTYHSLFVFSMNLLVVAPNLLQFFMGWELVGLTSYLLIGFYYQKPSAAYAAVKAFWMTKLADMGFLVGLLGLYLSTGSFAFNAQQTGLVATATTLALFVAVMGKSAQFPLHVWLPNAMEGPTPVSALLHAATMVAAGVYLLVRAAPLFVNAPTTLHIMLWVGVVTALFASFVALVQTDLKRVLAYSTCAQLGYMVAAAGAGASSAAYFHLVTHAFFKALLFLAAGSVIHAVHSNDMRKMGGLVRVMPLTTAAFGVGTLALMGFPGTAGFFSKDQVLEVILEHAGWAPAGLLLVGVGLTSLYMTRAFLLTFFGAQRCGAHAHPHESPTSMLAPLVLLMGGALATGWFGSSLAAATGHHYHFHFSVVGGAATLVSFAGLGLGLLFYGKAGLAGDERVVLRSLATFVNRALVDRAYAWTFSVVALGIARSCAWFDRYIIDGAMNYTGYVSLLAGRRLQRFQTGNVIDYVAAVVVGTLMLLTWGLFQ